jgi:hypothetical protein
MLQQDDHTSIMIINGLHFHCFSLMWQGGKRLRFMFGPPEGRPSKTQLHEAVVCPRVVPLAFPIWQVHNNPGAAIPPCANKPDNMEPYGRIPMLTHASHGTSAPAICCKIAKRPRPGKQAIPKKPSVEESHSGEATATLPHWQIAIHAWIDHLGRSNKALNFYLSMQTLNIWKNMKNILLLT